MIAVTTSQRGIQLPATPTGGVLISNSSPEPVTIYGAADGPLDLSAGMTAEFEWSPERRGWTLIKIEAAI